MMQIIKPGTNIDFVGKRNLFFIISAILMIASFALIFGKGYNWGIDFAGGTVVQVKFTDTVPLDEVRNILDPVIQGEYVIQNFGEQNEILIRIVEHSNQGLQELSDAIKDTLTASYASHEPTIQRVEQVGPQVGDELRSKAIQALLYATLGILIYIAVRFEMLFAIGAVLSLIHDTVFIMGFYALSGKEFNLTVMAAVFTAAGYSLNDTIVIFDRIREKIRSGALDTHSWKEVINFSLNETLSRTILTSFLTLLAVIALYLFGGEVLSGFALVMILGIVVGTYSSIGVAAMFVLLMHKRAKKAEKTALVTNA